jgi:hypothetical protein
MDDEEREVAARQDGAADATARETAPTPPAPKAPRKRRWGLMLFGIFVILPILLIALWTTIALSWAYSQGDRAGYIQKFSQKGWLCKTWEGEIAMVNMPGQAQEKFNFSVRSDSIAHEITRLMGNRVDITYEEHRGIPLKCFGETDYFVTGVRPAP